MAATQSSIKPASSRTALLYVEAISNPLLRVTDVSALAERAHAAGAKLCVDATFATPVLYRPAGLGADLVLHSLTKYINGHGDVMGGSVGDAISCHCVSAATPMSASTTRPHFPMAG